MGNGENGKERKGKGREGKGRKRKGEGKERKGGRRKERERGVPLCHSHARRVVLCTCVGMYRRHSCLSKKKTITS